jgi:ribosomal protein S27AE
MKREVEGQKMQATKLFTIDLTKIRGKGDFDCPKCGVKISPNEKTEKTYRILEAVMKQNQLEGIMLQCGRCDSQIHLTGFRALNMTR